MFVLSGIPFTWHFIKFVVVETKHIANSYLPADMLKRWPHVRRVKIVWSTTKESFCLNNNKSNVAPCKLKSTPMKRLVKRLESNEAPCKLKSLHLRIPNPTLRWGCVFLERTKILSGIQFTRHFIEFVIV